MSKKASPEIEDIKKPESNIITFRLKNSSVAFANALRRIMIAEIPTFAIEKVQFRENTSPLPEELIAHRLGLIPLSSEGIEDMRFVEECEHSLSGADISDCPKCSVYFVCNVTCTSQNIGSDGYRSVTSDDLKPFDRFSMDEFFDDPKYNKYKEIASHIKPAPIPVMPGGPPEPILIAKLSQGQSLQFMAIAEKGVGRVHSKWSPVAISSYYQPPKPFMIDQDKLAQCKNEVLDKVVKTCPKKIFSKSPTDQHLITTNENECIFCQQCYDVLEEFEQDYHCKDAIYIDHYEDVFNFTVETVGSLSPESVVRQGLMMLKKKLQNLTGDIEKAEKN